MDLRSILLFCRMDIIHSRVGQKCHVNGLYQKSDLNVSISVHVNYLKINTGVLFGKDF